MAMSDIVASTLLVIWGLILGPIGLLRGTLHLSNIFYYIWILSPQALLSRFVRAAIDWRLGNFDSAVFQLEFLVTRVEAAFTRHPKSMQIRIVLEDFYTLLLRSYLHGGHIDDAMLVVLRAKKSLACDRLPAMARLDAKTAHLVRAGLAAGRLIDGTGLATLYVKSTEALPNPPGSPKKTPTVTATTAPRQGASSRGYAPQKNKIIPFPTPTQRPLIAPPKKPTNPTNPSNLTPNMSPPPGLEPDA